MRLTAGLVIAALLTLWGVLWLGGPNLGPVAAGTDPLTARAIGVGFLLLAGLAWWQALRTPTRLRVAARHGRPEVVRELLGRGASPDARSLVLRRTPLMEASIRGRVEIVEALLAAGATVDARARGGVTALSDAARKGHTEAARRLIEAGADVNARDDGLYWTPMYLAAASNTPQLIHLLAASGARVDQPIAAQVTPLWTTASSGHFDACRALLECGADPSRQAADKRSAIQMAESKGHPNVLRLLEAVEGVRSAVRAQDESALEVGLQECRELDRRALTSSLLSRAIDDTDHVAIVHGLLRHGADPNARDDQGRPALVQAVECGATQSLLALIEAGAEIDQRDADGDTLLMCAVRSGDLATVRTLLSAGADPDATDSRGQSALEAAVLAGHPEVEATLLEGGAQRGTAYERLVVERQQKEERRRRQEAEAKELRELKKQSAMLHGGHQSCDRCAAGRPWSIQQSLGKAAQLGMDITFMGGAGSAHRPRDYAGSCLQCRDYFCQEHADGDRCAICGSQLIS